MINIADLPVIKKITEKYGYKFFVLIGLLGIFLIFVSEKSPSDKVEETTVFSNEEYRQQLETRLESILSDVKGAGKVEIMITLESGKENIYAWQEKSTSNEQTVSAQTNNQTVNNVSYENEIVTIGSGNDKQALIEKTMQPSVQGVVVVCQGADDIKVMSDITNAVSVVLDIPSNRICVIKMQ